MAALLLFSGNWFSGLCHAALLIYMAHLYTSRRMFVDTTDAFRQLPQQKLQRGIMLGVHLALFVLVVYRWVGQCGVQATSSTNKQGHMLQHSRPGVSGDRRYFHLSVPPISTISGR